MLVWLTSLYRLIVLPNLKIMMLWKRWTEWKLTSMEAVVNDELEDTQPSASSDHSPTSVPVDVSLIPVSANHPMQQTH